MQALIDFDGWRKWKDFADKSENNDTTSKLSVSYSSIAPNKKLSSAVSPTLAANPPDAKGVKKDGETERKSKRKSLSVVPPPVVQEEVETPPAEVDSGQE
jgi:osomolarity two-component system response regulator SSK1